MKIKIITILMMLNCVLNLKSQTVQQIEDQMNERYWVYRQRYQKFFTKIGGIEGNSIPIASYDSGLGIPVINKDLISAAIPDAGKVLSLNGRIKFGDASVDLGYYIAVV